MNAKKPIFLSVGVATILTFIIIGFNSRNNRNAEEQNNNAEEKSNVIQSNAAVARSIAVAEYWNHFFTRCGDDWYEKRKRGQINQYSGLSFYVKATALTEADKLNGYEWKGNLLLKAKAHRFRDGKRWSEWQEGLPWSIRLEILPHLVKKNGRWYLTEYWNDREKTFEISTYVNPNGEFDCAAVQQHTALNDFLQQSGQSTDCPEGIYDSGKEGRGILIKRNQLWLEYAGHSLHSEFHREHEVLIFQASGGNAETWFGIENVKSDDLITIKLNCRFNDGKATIVTDNKRFYSMMGGDNWSLWRENKLVLPKRAD